MVKKEETMPLFYWGNAPWKQRSQQLCYGAEIPNPEVPKGLHSSEFSAEHERKSAITSRSKSQKSSSFQLLADC